MCKSQSRRARAREPHRVPCVELLPRLHLLAGVRHVLVRAASGASRWLRAASVHLQRPPLGAQPGVVRNASEPLGGKARRQPDAAELGRVVKVNVQVLEADGKVVPAPRIGERVKVLDCGDDAGTGRTKVCGRSGEERAQVLDCVHDVL